MPKTRKNKIKEIRNTQIRMIAHDMQEENIPTLLDTKNTFKKMYIYLKPYYYV